MALVAAAEVLFSSRIPNIKITEHEVKGHDGFSANGSNDGIHLDPMREAVFGDISLKTMEQAILDLNVVFKRWVLSGAIFLYG